MTLSVSIRHRQGDFSLEAAFSSDSRLIALFGPSGSGKTTLVNLIGGLRRPDEGRIEADGRVLVDTAAGIFRPPHRRRVGYVFQDARLFPHLNVRHNLTFGRFFTPAAERSADFSAVVEMLGIGHLLDRRPQDLSGGEKQRVAIGRALLASPRLLLMDEPLASLDEHRKGEIMPYLERLRDEAKVPIVYVSHSVTEVSRLADHIVVLSCGRVAASGPTGEIFGRLDLIAGERGEGGSLVALTVVRQDDGDGLSLLRSSGGEWRLPRVNASEGARVRVRVRARDVTLSLDPPGRISALNVLSCVVSDIESDGGPEALVTLESGGDRLVARITLRSAALLGLETGTPVHAIVKAATFDLAAVGAAGIREPGRVAEGGDRPEESA